jgi:hypothetical protein
MTGRLFGWESEFEAGSETLLPVLYDRGLIADPDMHAYHCRCSDCDPLPDRVNPFTAQEDCSCDVEVISKPFAFGSDEHMNTLDAFAAALRDGEATPGRSAGNHVHVNREDMEAGDHRRLWRLFTRYADDLDYIAKGGFKENRGYNSPPNLRYSLPERRDIFWNGNDEEWFSTFREHGASCSWLTPRSHVTYEFRLWNSTRMGWRIFLHSALSVAMVEAAVGGVEVVKDDPRELPEVLGDHLHPEAIGLLVRQLQPQLTAA